MFLSISTETGVKEINVYELQTYKSIDDESGKYIYYIMCNGITFSEYFDTDADREAKLEEISNLNPGGGGGGGSYTLPVASSTTLGGIKVGDNLSIDENGILSGSAGSVLGDYTEFDTKENAINIDNLEPGLYFISVKNGARVGSTRFYAKYTYGGQVLFTQIGPPGSLNSHYAIGDFISLLIEQKLQSGDFILGRVKYLCQDTTNKNIATGSISIRINNGSLTQSGSYEDFAMVLRSGAQTISGVKTFNTLPESSITPTTNNQLVNKKYVDGTVPLLLPPTLLLLSTSFTSAQIVEALGGQDLLDKLLAAVDTGNRAVFGAGTLDTGVGTQKAITPITVISQVDDSLGVRYLMLEGTMKGAWSKPNILRYTLVQTLATSEWTCVEASFISVSDFDPTLVSGYDPTKTQVLKNINGTLSWVDDSSV